MLRLPVINNIYARKSMRWRLKSTSSSIRSTFIEYFKDLYGHTHVKSSSVVPLCDPTVPFVNAGMNQFKGVFLGKCAPLCLRAVNSQKCVRVGGKHNDLEAVGLDGHHHTFFEMLGNWSFGDYYKKEACEMAWNLLIGPYRLKPQNLVVTYFSGDVVLKLQEDRECRDIWKSIGVPAGNIKGTDARDNFWEMGATGPCGPCTEIHHVNPDGSLTEIWNIVFIQCNREADGSVVPLNKHHIDTGMGLERMATLLQGVPSNYDTDLFQPIIKAIEMKSMASPYTGQFGASNKLDVAYRRLADHARMISVCLADGAFPASSLNLKQIMRRSFKISEDIFKCKSGMLSELYDHVTESLGPVYPELVSKERDAKKIIECEEQAYSRLRANISKKWRDLLKQHPEVASLQDVELSGFTQAYKEFKQAMASNNSTTIPGDVMFKLYDTYGFEEVVIERMAKLNNVDLDKEGFNRLLKQHKARHKTALKEQTDNMMASHFNNIVDDLNEKGFKPTDDNVKYDYSVENNKIVFEPLTTKLLAIMNIDGDSIDYLETNESDVYYLVTEQTNFYCENGGQSADSGYIDIKEIMQFNIDSIFKVRDYVFHKGKFVISDNSQNRYIKVGNEVTLHLDSDKRLKTMRNHTAIHLLNAALRKVLPGSVVCQVGSKVSEQGLVLHLSVYGDKLTQKIVMDAQNLVRKVIEANVPVQTSIVDQMQLSQIDNVVTVPGETYPETGLRLIEAESNDLMSRELCCGTHVPYTGLVEEFGVILVKGAGSQAPSFHAVTGDAAMKVRELYSHTQKLKAAVDILDSGQMKEEIASIQQRLADSCGPPGAAYGDHGACLTDLDFLQREAAKKDDVALHAVVEMEMREIVAEAERQRRRFIVHFLRCSYMMQSASVSVALQACPDTPALVLGCANGVINAACVIPEGFVTKEFTSQKWMSCILPVFKSYLAPLAPGQAPETHAAMIGTKVSLITCESLVQDAMLAAIHYADAHCPDHSHGTGSQAAQLT